MGFSFTRRNGKIINLIHKEKRSMHAFQEEFIEFTIKHGILQFGDFTLKSGRKSHYFFNAGQFNNGHLLGKLGEFYARSITVSNLAYDILFGPAYKGIPLVSTTAIALSINHHLKIPFAFNRKEVKNHGEGGDIVGAPLAGRVLIVDDVITAGTAIRQSIEIIKKHNATPVGIIIALDREEKGEGELSAVAEIETQFEIPVLSIITLSNIKEYLSKDPHHRSILEKLIAA
jgi:orotate phosphoribosyltransferase